MDLHAQLSTLRIQINIHIILKKKKKKSRNLVHEGF